LSNLLKSKPNTLHVVSPDWLSDSLKTKTLVPHEDYLVTLHFPLMLLPKDSMKSGKTDEEEKKDTVVRLEDIMHDIYALKFNTKKDKINESKKRA
jgi:hypothetical protein